LVKTSKESPDNLLGPAGQFSVSLLISLLMPYWTTGPSGLCTWAWAPPPPGPSAITPHALPLGPAQSSLICNYSPWDSNSNEGSPIRRLRRACSAVCSRCPFRAFPSKKIEIDLVPTSVQSSLQCSKNDDVLRRATKI
jgi:hypothetical protein